MPDYRDLGYNQFMEKNPFLETTRYSSLQTKGLIPVGAISFDKASGGELTIGGKDNSGGVISVRDDNALERILINSSGITITDGKITIVDSEGTTVIDGFGLVSSGSFSFDSVEGAVATQTDTTGTPTDIVGISLSFTLSRSTQVIFFYTSAGFISRNLDSGAGQACRVALNIDGTIVGTTMEFQGSHYVSAWGAAATRGSTDMAWNTGSGHLNMSHYPVTLAAGTHTVKLQMNTSDALYTAYVFKSFTRLSYLTLGK